jgi:2-phosphoglycerate kinase
MEKLELGHVLWLGGMSGVGKTTNGRAVARRFDLRFYALDSYTLDHHRNRVRPEEHPALASFDRLSVEELWVNTTGEEIADRFEAACRERFAFVLDDVRSLPRDAPILVEGPQLLPELVAPLLEHTDQALYLVADGDLQRKLVVGRGGAGYARSSDPERALANRLERDRILTERLRVAAAERGLSVQRVSDPAEAPGLIEAQFRRALAAWDARGERGDVAARRREENDARLLQWRLYAAEAPRAAAGEVPLACECEQQGCTLTVPVTLGEAESGRARSQPFLAPEHEQGR